MSETKYCEDCKYVHCSLFDVVTFAGYQFAECTHPSVATVGKVGVYRGDTPRFCRQERISGACGYSAKNFEPRK